MRRALILSAFLVCAASGPALASGAPSVSLSVGINMEGVADWSGGSQFVDVMKASRHFGSVNTPWDEAAKVDANGWPLQDAGVVALTALTDAAGHPLDLGAYQLSFTGQATVTVGFVPNGVSNTHYDLATNTTVATVTIPANTGAAQAGIFLSFANSRRLPTDAPGTGVTNVSLIRPRLAPNGQPWWTTSGQTFTTPWLDLLAPFSTLRAMDWASTNNSPVTSWRSRTLSTWSSQAQSSGVSWGYVIQLANQLHKDLWVNIPDQASDDYINQMAALFGATFDPTLHLYLEYSNEVWNYSFQQAGRNQAAAEAEVKANPNSRLAWQCLTDYNDCRWIWGERRIGVQTAKIYAAFRKAFGAHAANLRPIFATQVGNGYVLANVLPMLDHFYGIHNVLWGVAQAPYWSGDNTLDGLTKTQELANAEANRLTLSAPEALFSAWSLYYGLQNVTYEGGPGMSGTPSLDAKIAANRDPAMGAQVTAALRQAAGAGVSLYNYFSSSGIPGQYGMWGAAETVFDVSQPKYQALLGIVANPKATLTAGALLPGAVDPTQPMFTNGSLFIEPGYAYLRNTGEIVLLVDAPAAGAYAVTPSVATYYSGTTGALRVNDGAAAAAVRIPFTNNSLTFVAAPAVAVQLVQGLNILRFSAPHAEWAISTVAVAKLP